MTDAYYSGYTGEEVDHAVLLANKIPVGDANSKFLVWDETTAKYLPKTDTEVRTLLGFTTGNTLARNSLSYGLSDVGKIHYDTDDLTPYFWSGTEWT